MKPIKQAVILDPVNTCKVGRFYLLCRARPIDGEFHFRNEDNKIIGVIPDQSLVFFLGWPSHYQIKVGYGDQFGLVVMRCADLYEYILVDDDGG